VDKCTLVWKTVIEADTQIQDKGVVGRGEVIIIRVNRGGDVGGVVNGRGGKRRSGQREGDKRVNGLLEDGRRGC